MGLNNINMYITLLLFCTIFLGIGCTGQDGNKLDNGAENSQIAQFDVFSSVFENNESIPVAYTCDGENINPPLQFSGIPDDAKILVLIVDDPDATEGVFTHWIVWNINPESNIMENSVPGIEGENSFGEVSYGGPCPPSDTTHRYIFGVYALDTELNLDGGANRQNLESAMDGHILAKGELIGLYGR